MIALINSRKIRRCGVIQEVRMVLPLPQKLGQEKLFARIVVPSFGELQVNFLWADPGVLWKKAPRAMRARRGKTLECTIQPYFGCTKGFLKVLSN